jgi:hypothetical protein
MHHLSLPQTYPASRLHWPLRNKAAAHLIPLPPHSLGTIANEAAHQGMFAAVGDICPFEEVIYENCSAFF